MRRLLLVLIHIAVLAVALLAACAPVRSTTARDPSPQPQAPPALPMTLTIWHSWSGARLDALNTLARSYEQANPDTRIRLESQPVTDIIGVYSRSVADGAAPQVLMTLGRYVGDLAERQAIAPLNDVLPEEALRPLAPAALDSARVGDQLYAAPLAYEGLVLFYDRRRTAAPPATIEQAIALNAPLRNEPPETRPWSLGYYLSLETTLPYLYGVGGAVLDEQGQPVFADAGREATLRWLEWLKSLQSNPDVIASYDYSVVDAAIQEGRVWSAIDWSYRRGAYAQIWGADAVGIAPLPALAAEAPPRSLIVADVLYLNPVASAEQRAAAQAFARYMIAASSQEVLLTRGGLLPAHSEVPLPDDLAEVRAALNEAQGLSGALTAPGVWRPLNDMFRSVISNAAPISEAVDAAGASLRRSSP